MARSQRKTHSLKTNNTRQGNQQHAMKKNGNGKHNWGNAIDDDEIELSPTLKKMQYIQ
jgi:hypothetical protein